MPVTLATAVTVEIRGWPGHWCPRNWSNDHRPWRAKHAEVQQWKARAAALALEARLKARWPVPERTRVPEPRYLDVVIWKYMQWPFDADGAVSAVKPLVDGLEGQLIVKDSHKWLRWITPIDRIQRPAKAVNLQRVDLTIYLTDPREER